MTSAASMSRKEVKNLCFIEKLRFETVTPRVSSAPESSLIMMLVRTVRTVRTVRKVKASGLSLQYGHGTAMDV